MAPDQVTEVMGLCHSHLQDAEHELCHPNKSQLWDMNTGKTQNTAK